MNNQGQILNILAFLGYVKRFDRRCRTKNGLESPISI